MGEQADFMFEREIDRQIYPFGVDVLMADPARDAWRKALGDMEWTTKEGEKIRLQDMELSHLRNVSALLARREYKHAARVADYYRWRATLAGDNA